MVRIVIVEDDKLTARTIRHFCQTAFQSEKGNAGGASGAATVMIRQFDRLVPALYYIRENPIDLLVLDINLHGESGFDILKTPEKNAFYTIIVSSDTANAVNAFDYGVLDFIVKPFTRERFMAGIARMRNAAEAQGQYKNSLPIKKDGMIELIRYREILYLQAVGNFTDICLKDGRSERIRRTMDSILAELNSDFFRSHRSYIINLAEVNKIMRAKNNTYAVIVGGEHEIALSRSRYNLLKKILTDDGGTENFG
ncbi:MAG: LytTR family DNA-binding domain-containing protein [bacterium]|nr:LytTR family DNA-binding domain-containing protein [bacterium]